MRFFKKDANVYTYILIIIEKHQGGSEDYNDGWNKPGHTNHCFDQFILLCCNILSLSQSLPCQSPRRMSRYEKYVGNIRTKVYKKPPSGEINAGVHVHDDVPLDVDLEHGDDGDDAADRGRRGRGHQ